MQAVIFFAIAAVFLGVGTVFGKRARIEAHPRPQRRHARIASYVFLGAAALFAVAGIGALIGEAR